MDAELLRRYADLIVSVGANVQPGQVVQVEADPEALPLVHALTVAAYDRGARFVDVSYFDPQVKRIRLERAAEDTLDYVPPWLGERLLQLADLNGARIVLVPRVPPGLLEGIDPARAARDRLPLLDESTKVINDRATSWTLAPYPLAAWARLVHPDLDAGAAVAKLWKELVHVCRLDEPDPAAAWRERFAALRRAAAALNELRLDSLRFEGPGTDLTIGLLPSSRFIGASLETRTGIEHVPNIPTEEVFTAPDPERVDGTVTATKPLDLEGAVVEGLRVRFERGRAIEIDADTNAELVRARAARDEGAARLGEVALVDREGRVGGLATTFFTTLLDENAASHVAIGDAYSFTVAEEDLGRINRSSVHVDFMIGSDEVDVTGTTAAGAEVPVLRGGAWQI
jgi:aminopeptidase